MHCIFKNFECVYLKMFPVLSQDDGIVDYFKHLFPSDFLVSLIATVFNMSFIYSDKGIISP